MKKTSTSAAKAAAPKRARGRPRSFDREQALERAMEVFWGKGFEGASLSDLTDAMGINPPSLYAAFGDKEQLCIEAMERYQARARSRTSTPRSWRACRCRRRMASLARASSSR